jgi:L-serine dehydratase
MESLSIFDIFKIGVGPSSSHTLGPWRAALQFVDRLDTAELDRIQIQLYGSLSKTGIGHATNKAVLLGLLGYDPKKINTDRIASYIKSTQDSQKVKIKSKTISFDYEKDIIFGSTTHPLHPNTLKFTAFSTTEVIKEELFASVGGGFIESSNRTKDSSKERKLPFQIFKGEDILAYTKEHSCSISDIVYKNECSIRSKHEIDVKIEAILDTFLEATHAGLTTGGILPGGLKVVRRAKNLCDQLLKGKSIETTKDWLDLIKGVPKDFNSINKWISCFALAVNEQNAAMGRIVTSPTNGAAGVQ